MHSKTTFKRPWSCAKKVLFCGRVGCTVSDDGGEETKFQSDESSAVAGAAVVLLARPEVWNAPDAGLVPFCCIEGVAGRELGREPDETRLAKGSAAGAVCAALCCPGVGVAGFDRGRALVRDAKAS